MVGKVNELAVVFKQSGGFIAFPTENAVTFTELGPGYYLVNGIDLVVRQHWVIPMRLLKILVQVNIQKPLKERGQQWMHLEIPRLLVHNLFMCIEMALLHCVSHQIMMVMTYRHYHVNNGEQPFLVLL